jgi:predicted DNA-binding protein (MmcQ/YjbR family)
LTDSDAALVAFEQLAAAYEGRPGVSHGRIWHNDGLTVGGKIFAMVVRGELVVKVPAARAATLVDSGTASRFEPSPGRAMREWVSVPLPRAGRRSGWEGLVAEAYAYVGGRPGPR